MRTSSPVWQGTPIRSARGNNLAFPSPLPSDKMTPPQRQILSRSHRQEQIMSDLTVSRRRLMQLGLGTATAGLAAAVPAPLARALQASPGSEDPDPGLAASIPGAFAFLDQMM